MNFTTLMFESDGDKYKYIKIHVCQDSLIDTVISNLRDRGHNMPYFKNSSHLKPRLPKDPPKSFYWDIGGPMLINRHLESIYLDGFEITVPSQDFDFFIETLERTISNPRPTLNGGFFVKVHSVWNCLALDLDLAKDLLTKAKAIAKSAEVNAQKDNADFLAVITRAQENGIYGPSAKQEAILAKMPQILSNKEKN